MVLIIYINISDLIIMFLLDYCHFTKVNTVID